MLPAVEVQTEMVKALQEVLELAARAAVQMQPHPVP
jgi:hypothetical protein